jgi:hypothetical protein
MRMWATRAGRDRRRAARRDYWAAEDTMSQAWDQLDRAGDPGERAALLRRVAQAHEVQVTVYRGAWGRDRLPGGMDMATSLGWQVVLCRALADVETAAAGATGRAGTATGLGADADAVLDRMAAIPSLAARMDHLPDLYAAVVGTVGGQAAELVAVLPWPGRDRSEVGQ